MTAPPTPGTVGVVFWVIIIGIPACLLIRVVANAERKRQQREGKRRP